MKANAHCIAKVHTVSNVRMIAKVTVLLKLLTPTSFEDGDKFHVRDIDIWFHDEFVDHGSHFFELVHVFIGIEKHKRVEMHATLQ